MTIAAEKASFIDDAVLERLLGSASVPTAARLGQILDKAALAQGLNLEEVADLLMVEDPDQLQAMFRTAYEIKEKIYGNRIVLFAPLYVSNLCVNNCRYCGFRRSNEQEVRRRLTQEEVAEEVRALLRMGHKRVLLEAGEDPRNCDIDYIVDCIRTIYGVREGNGNIRRINVNIAATTVENYRRLKAAQIGTYQLFQETYHRPTYALMHPEGPKHNYDWHTTALDRAQEAGIDDVGAGVLFGLYDYRYEVLALLLHVRHLEERFGVGPHTISVPRLQPAPGVDLQTFPHLVSDEQFYKLVAVLRLAVPYTGMIISTRETPEVRAQVLKLGVSQMSAGSSVGIGGYSQAHREEQKATLQFTQGDHRSPDEVIRWLCEEGYLPSYCTACYRQGRTGDRFMALAKTGQIQNLCQPNALLTFQEYLEDYATAETREVGRRTEAANLALIPSAKMRAETEKRLARIKAGERDLYF
ncbi:2-iminoacetate synthase [Symbiobacterium terraclitae]|uniref:2-iminoacetate synthase n=1 Tax=Symbiobacterium terraclitae TaxID=557451 RepID=A0ABS4JUU6_9FIRM|nr:[FeFe] hydrogenase H-cluster radical SAM maturase HydG [Symbiobacterium terraclitae]MBP2018661.1 2-iminoacetate synthase [Symbiobacterium terraclitae]